MPRKMPPVAPSPRNNALRAAHVAKYGDKFTVPPETRKKLNALAKSFEKSFSGALVRTNEAEERDLSAGGLSTGFQEIDDVLSGSLDKDLETVAGTGVGFPRGRIVEISGPEASGKTSLALMTVAVEQRRGGTVGFIDAEHALDLTYARTLGVNTDALLLTQPDSGEQGLRHVDMLVRKGVDLIVVDSVAALVPEAELKGDMGKASMGMQARLMSQACRKLNALLQPGGPTIIFINQIRMKLGVMFGNPETTSGGNALKFYASIRCDIRRIKKLMKTNAKDGERSFYGNRVKMETTKNKVAPPHRYVIYDILLNKGIRIPSKAQVKADKLADQARFGGGKK